MPLASRSRLIAATLMIGTIAAPAASARPDLHPPGVAQAQAGQGGAVVRPNTVTSRPSGAGSQGVPPILRPATASELAAINRAEAQEARRLAYNLPRTARYSNTEMNAYASAAHPVAASTPTSEAPSNSFDYRAAAVGAGLTGAIMLLITAGILRRRGQLSHQ